MGIFDLSTEILMGILRSLRIEDQISVAGVCSRFAKLICPLIEKQVVRVETVLQSLPSGITQFLSACGKSIKHIVFADDSTLEWFDLFAKYCSHLEEVEIVKVNDGYYWKKLSEFFKNCAKLLVVKVAYCCLDEDTQLIVFRSLPQVRNLVGLKLFFCDHINPEYFKNMLEANEKLKEIYITGCLSLVDEIVFHALGNHENIERISLDIEFFAESEVFPEFPKLKHITILPSSSGFSHDSAVTDSLNKFFGDHSATLESMDLGFWNFTDVTEWPTFERLTKLAITNAVHLEDDLLRKIGEACKLLEEADLMQSTDNVTGEGLLRFIRVSENLTYLKLWAFEPYDEELLMRIYKIKRTMSSQLTIACNNSKWKEMLRSQVCYKLRTNVVPN